MIATKKFPKIIINFAFDFNFFIKENSRWFNIFFHFLHHNMLLVYVGKFSNFFNLIFLIIMPIFLFYRTDKTELFVLSGKRCMIWVSATLFCFNQQVSPVYLCRRKSYILILSYTFLSFTYFSQFYFMILFYFLNRILLFLFIYWSITW